LKTGDQEREDREANLFAMCLLMPEAWVRREIEKMGGLDISDDKQLRVLAKKFQVGETLMAIRIGQIYKGAL